MVKWDSVSSDDLAYIAANMREDDKAELYAAHGPDVDIEALLAQSHWQSAESFILRAPSGEPLAILGFVPAPYDSYVAIPWLLGVPNINKHTKGFIRASQAVLDSLLGVKYSYMCNYVHEKHETSIRYLKFLGFQFGEVTTVEDTGENFVYFYQGEREGCLNLLGCDTLLTG